MQTLGIGMLQRAPFHRCQNPNLKGRDRKCHALGLLTQQILDLGER